MNLKEYAESMEGKSVDYDGVWGTQCVDLIKHYTNAVLGVRLGTFGGSAKTGWENRSNTFPSDVWERIENDFTKPNQIPKPGDIIFFKGGLYGHVAIILEAIEGVNLFTVLDQNTGNGDGVGTDDRIKIQSYSYNNVSGWYSYKSKNYEEMYNTLKAQIRELAK